MDAHHLLKVGQGQFTSELSDGHAQPHPPGDMPVSRGLWRKGRLVCWVERALSRGQETRNPDQAGEG